MLGKRDAVADVVSRETLARFDAYEALLGKWNPRINLVAPGSIGQFWIRHVADSIQLLDLAPERTCHWADLGSGGGFPGLAIAMLALERRPGISVTCVESDQRKSAFLRTVSRETSTPLTVIADRIERIPPLEADVVSARALAPLPRLLDLAKPHLGIIGIGLFSKGARYADEISEAQKHWRFSVESLTSKTDRDAVILRIGDLARV